MQTHSHISLYRERGEREHHPSYPKGKQRHSPFGWGAGNTVVLAIHMERKKKKRPA